MPHGPTPTRRSRRVRPARKGRSPLWLAIVAAAALVVTTAAWIVADRGDPLPPHYHEVELSVSGMH